MGSQLQQSPSLLPLSLLLLWWTPHLLWGDGVSIARFFIRGIGDGVSIATKPSHFFCCWGMMYQMLTSSVGVGMGSNPRPTTSSKRSYVIVDPPYLTLHIVGTMPSMETSSIPTVAFQSLPSLAHSPGGTPAPYAYQPPLPMQPAAIGPPPRRPQRPTTMLALPPLPPGIL